MLIGPRRARIRASYREFGSAECPDLCLPRSPQCFRLKHHVERGEIRPGQRPGWVIGQGLFVFSTSCDQQEPSPGFMNSGSLATARDLMSSGRPGSCRTSNTKSHDVASSNKLAVIYFTFVFANRSFAQAMAVSEMSNAVTSGTNREINSASSPKTASNHKSCLRRIPVL